MGGGSLRGLSRASTVGGVPTVEVRENSSQLCLADALARYNKNVRHFPSLVSGGLPTPRTPRGLSRSPGSFPGVSHLLFPGFSRGESRERCPEQFASRSGFRKDDLFYVNFHFSISFRLGVDLVVVLKDIHHLSRPCTRHDRGLPP